MMTLGVFLSKKFENFDFLREIQILNTTFYRNPQYSEEFRTKPKFLFIYDKKMIPIHPIQSSPSQILVDFQVTFSVLKSSFCEIFVTKSMIVRV